MDTAHRRLAPRITPPIQFSGRAKNALAATKEPTPRSHGFGTGRLVGADGCFFMANATTISVSAAAAAPILCAGDARKFSEL
jgi:hypothetical protein